MSMPEKLDMVPENLRKEMGDFVSKNATFIFTALNNYDEGVLQIYRNYGEMAKIHRSQISTYRKAFLDMLLADSFDKAAAAKLAQDLFSLLDEQNRTFDDCRASLFDDYRGLMNVIGAYLMFVSEEGIDLSEVLGESKEEEK